MISIVATRPFVNNKCHLDDRLDSRTRMSNDHFPLDDMISLIRIILHLSIDSGEEMHSRLPDLPGSAKCHYGVKVSDLKTSISFRVTNDAHLSECVMLPWKHVSFCRHDVSEFIFHNGSFGIKSFHGDCHVTVYVLVVELVRVVCGHGAIVLESHGAVNRESFGKALAREMGQAIRVVGEHWEAILQIVTHHFPGTGEFPCRTYGVYVEVTVWRFGTPLSDNGETLAVAHSIYCRLVRHVRLKECCAPFHFC